MAGATPEPVWEPGQAERNRSRLPAVMSKWGFDDLAALRRASVDDPEWFWRAAVEDLQVEFSTPFTKVLDDSGGTEAGDILVNYPFLPMEAATFNDPLPGIGRCRAGRDGHARHRRDR
jgi:hypothetical protein